MRKQQIIIVAGGSGVRMGAGVPKQFILVAGKPILTRTLESFSKVCQGAEVVVVLPESHIDYWKECCRTYGEGMPHQVVAGGETRFHSVKNGLAALSNHPEALIAVHDGVRPFADGAVILKCFEQASVDGAVIPVIEVFETLRELHPIGSATVDRTQYRLVQTPQVFDSAILRKSYQQSYMPSFTDDASVVESLGYKVSLVSGNRENIKVTSPFDLKIAEGLV